MSVACCSSQKLSPVLGFCIGTCSGFGLYFCMFYLQLFRKPGQELGAWSASLPGLRPGDAQYVGSVAPDLDPRKAKNLFRRPGNQSLMAHDHRELDPLTHPLFGKVRVLCWLLRSPVDEHIRDTWGRRCNKLIFVNWQADLKTGKRERNLWGHTRDAWTYIHEHYMAEADWFLKADHSHYFVMENLRFLLSFYRPDNPVVFGRSHGNLSEDVTLGAGYVLSKEALNRLVTGGIADPSGKLCRHDVRGDANKEVERCLRNLQVLIADARDSEGQARFMQTNFLTLFISKANKTFSSLTTEEKECCSDTAIAFREMRLRDLYNLEFSLYHWRPFGIKEGAERHQHEVDSIRDKSRRLIS